MSPAHAFPVSLLESSLAAHSAGVVLELRATLGEAVCAGLGRFDDLAADARMRLRYLIEAMALDCPGLYEEFLLWQRATHVSRGLEPRILASALDGQRRVLAQGLPGLAFATLEPFLAAGEAALSAPPAGAPRAIEGPQGMRVAELLERALTGKRTEFMALARRALDELGEEVLVEELLVGVLTEVGYLWQHGELHIGEEHLASRLVEDTLAQIPNWAPREPALERRVMIASPSGDLHELGARMVATRFERRGWDVILLGANVPGPDLARSAVELSPEVVLISVSQGLFVRSAADSVAALRAARPEVLVLVGGAPFRDHPELAARIGADGMTRRASEAESLARSGRSAAR